MTTLRNIMMLAIIASLNVACSDETPPADSGVAAAESTSGDVQLNKDNKAERGDKKPQVVVVVVNNDGMQPRTATVANDSLTEEQINEISADLFSKLEKDLNEAEEWLYQMYDYGQSVEADLVEIHGDDEELAERFLNINRAFEEIEEGIYQAWDDFEADQHRSLSLYNNLTRQIVEIEDSLRALEIELTNVVTVYSDDDASNSAD